MARRVSVKYSSTWNPRQVETGTCISSTEVGSAEPAVGRKWASTKQNVWRESLTDKMICGPQMQEVGREPQAR